MLSTKPSKDEQNEPSQIAQAAKLFLTANRFTPSQHNEVCNDALAHPTPLILKYPSKND